MIVWNRTDGDLQDRLVPLQVSLLDEQRKAVWQQLVTKAPDPQATIHLSPVPLQLNRVGPPAAAAWIRLGPFARAPLPHSATSQGTDADDRRVAFQQQADQLSTFYRSIAPQLEPIRNRLQEL